MIYRANGGLFETVFAQRLFNWRNVHSFLLVRSRCLLGTVLSERASRLVTLKLPVDLTWTALVFLEGGALDLARPTSALISSILVLLIGVWTWQRGRIGELIGDHHQPRAVVTEEAAVELAVEAAAQRGSNIAAGRDKHFAELKCVRRCGPFLTVYGLDGVFIQSSGHPLGSYRGWNRPVRLIMPACEKVLFWDLYLNRAIGTHGIYGIRILRPDGLATFSVSPNTFLELNLSHLNF